MGRRPYHVVHPSVADAPWYSPYKTEFVISNDGQLTKLTVGTGALRDDFEGKTVRLAASINMAGREFTPIGGYHKGDVEDGYQ